MTGVAYSSSTARLGTVGVNYYETDDAYGVWGDLTSVTDARGYTTAYAYDAQGNLYSVTDPLDHTTTFRLRQGRQSDGHDRRPRQHHDL